MITTDGFRNKTFEFAFNMNKHWALLISGSILGIAFYAFLFFSHFGQSPALPENLGGFALSILSSIAIIYAVLSANTQLDKHLSWKSYFLLRFDLSIAVAMIISILIITIVLFLYFSLFQTIGINDFTAEYRDESIKMLILLLFISIIFNAGYFGFYSYRQYAFVQISKVAQDRKQLRLQFEALKSQLSPHYLFNSLNTISSLVYKDPSSAEEFIRRLALTFKYVITTDKHKLVPLKEEVEFIKSYYHLLKVRFGNSLNLDINLPDNILSSVIPPLTLQILVENAVKHNQINPDNRLEIYVGAVDNKFLRITNNKVAPADDVDSFRVGLENIRKRYSFYSDITIKVEDEETFMVQLPIIQLLKAG